MSLENLALHLRRSDMRPIATVVDARSRCRGGVPAHRSGREIRRSSSISTKHASPRGGPGARRFRSQPKPLWGLPFAIKDNIDVAGMPTTAACPDYAYRRPNATPMSLSSSCAKPAPFRSARPISTNSPRVSSACARLIGVPKNAIDPGDRSGRFQLRLGGLRWRGGILPFALGTDTAGSGRVPGGAEQHRRTEAEPRYAVGDGHGSGLPHPRHHLYLSP